MKSRILLVVSMLVAVMVLALAGCGGGEASGDATSAVVEEGTPAPVEAETIEQAVTEQIAEAVDTKTKVDALIGSWVDVNDATRFVNITTDGSAYTYEDNEGKLAAAFENGVLKISVSDTDKAEAYIDPTTEHLMVVYQDNISEYSKK